MKARTVSINYEPGEFYMTQGHKGNERRHRNKSGRLITPTGFGWGSVSKPSRITVGIEVKDKYAEVFVDYYFKSNWGKLTAGRVQAIKDTMPSELNITKNETASGGTYYTVAEESMDSWLEDAMAAR